MEKINVALIGQGFMGRAHSNAWGQVNKFFDPPTKPVMHTVFGQPEEDTRGFADNWGWQNISNDWQQLVASPEIDLVDVATPTYLHAAVSLAAVKAGKHCASEKPVAATLDDAREMMEAAKAAGVKTFVFYNYRRCPAVALAHQLVRDGKLGAYPLDGLLRGSWDGDTLCVAEEGFSCRLTFVTVDDNTTLIRAKAEKTYNTQNTALLQLQFQLHDGGLASINGKSATLGAGKIEHEGAMILAHNGWSAALPAGSSFQWPVYTYHPYGSVRIPENLHNAVGRVAVSLPDGEWVEVKITVD